MSVALTRQEKGRELDRIDSCIAGLGNVLAEILDKGEASESDLQRIEKGLQTAEKSVTALKGDYGSHPDYWGP